MMFFGKKPKKRQQREIPVDIVRNLASKGMSEPEIVSVLRKQGYSPYEIERALSIALKSTVTGVSQPQRFPQQIPSPKEYPPLEQKAEPQQIQQYPATAPQFTPSSPAETFTQKPNLPEFHTVPIPSQKEETEPLFTFEKTPALFSEKKEKPEISEPLEKFEEKESVEYHPSTPEVTLEEIIEGILADKWTDFEETIERLRRRDDELQKQIIEIRKEIDSIKDAMRKSEESFMAKLEEHGNQVANIEVKIGSIEKVFKEFLPELTESMRLVTEALEKTKKKE